MTKASLEAYLQNIKSGRAEGQSELVIESLMWRKFASTYEISQDVGVKTNTVGARLNAMLSIGCVCECGEKKHGKRAYTVYMWVDSPENWPMFANAYRKKLALKRVQAIANNAGEHSKGMAIRAQLEAEEIEKELKKLMVKLPEINKL